MRDSIALAHLRRRLETLEPRRCSDADLFTIGHDGIDRALGGGLARGRVHELFAGEADANSALGSAVMLGLRSGAGRGGDRPLLWLRCEAAQKRGGAVLAGGLSELGVDPEALLLGLMPDEAALLQAAGDAMRCTGLGALVVECWGSMRGLDLTATRRLMLAAEASAVPLFLVRVAANPAPSAADTRWRVASAPSVPLEADAPGAPMFDLEIMRRRAGPPAGPWRVEWNRDRLCFQEPAYAARAPLPRPVLPLVAGGAVDDQPMRRAM